MAVIIPAAVNTGQVSVHIDQVEGPVPGVRVLGHLKLGRQVLLEQITKHLRCTRRYPLIDGDGVVSEVPLHLQAVPVLLCEVIHTVQHHAGHCAGQEGIRYPEGGDVYAGYNCKYNFIMQISQVSHS